MTNYVKTTDFEAKDSLPSGDANKVVKGAEFEAEFDDIATAIATKIDDPANLASEVTGTLPVANGGTGATAAAGARTSLGVDAAGTDNSTDVTLAGTPDYLTIAGQVITRNQIDLTADVTGALPSANGGLPNIHAYGVVRGGVLQSGSYGISSVSVISGGVFDVTLSSAVSATSTALCMCTIVNDPDGFKDTVYIAQSDFIDTTSIEVGTVLHSWSGTLSSSYFTKDFAVFVMDLS